MDKIVGKKRSYLAMKTDSVAANELISSDLKEIGNAVKKLANHAVKLGSLGFGTIFLEWIASFAAIYLLILDRTNWKTNILTSLLIPYIFLSLPSLIFNLLRGEIGKWIALIAVVLRLFFPRRFPDWLELPGALILLIVVAPSFLAGTIRDSWIGILICLVIGCYLLQEHIRASGGFRNSFTKSNGISNTIGIVILLVYPVWALILYIL
ncbi:cold-regulated 413 plasma membrane 1-like [Olea europaea subsp. europaea]|uniref:Cold-regulated 413 plasma membrane 1-like n=1 Tax=Olea europaea subsp. europaea TaxID=158383 RepID=A0A8S0PDX8_OLEEU|nr:cold-regulated 413 plasma membrane 1-like [Olea europaea subsp. europaea]